MCNTDPETHHQDHCLRRHHYMHTGIWSCLIISQPRLISSHSPHRREASWTDRSEQPTQLVSPIKGSAEMEISVITADKYPQSVQSHADSPSMLASLPAGHQQSKMQHFLLTKFVRVFQHFDICHLFARHHDTGDAKIVPFFQCKLPFPCRNVEPVFV